MKMAMYKRGTDEIMFVEVGDIKPRCYYFGCLNDGRSYQARGSRRDEKGNLYAQVISVGRTPPEHSRDEEGSKEIMDRLPEDKEFEICLGKV